MENGTLTIVKPHPAIAVVECRGEHDLTTQAMTTGLIERLINENDLVVIDVTKTSFIDSTFIHGLLKAHVQAKKQGKQLRLQVATAAIVERALEITGVLDIIDWAGTREEAIDFGTFYTSGGGY